MNANKQFTVSTISNIIIYSVKKSRKDKNTQSQINFKHICLQCVCFSYSCTILGSGTIRPAVLIFLYCLPREINSYNKIMFYIQIALQCAQLRLT